MTANFTEKTVNKTAERKLTTALSTISNLQTVVTAWASNESLGLTANEVKKINLQVPIVYFSGMGDETGTIIMKTTLLSKYDDAVEFLEDNADVVLNMTGDEEGEGAQDDEEASWMYEFSCKLGNDSFQMSFQKDKVVLKNYSNDATLAAVETWCDNQALLA